MPVLFAYLLKVSVSLGVIYFFYRLVLQNLTFYSWNRWYLLGFSMVSFFLPLVNITALIQPNQYTTTRLITYVPALESYTTQPLPGPPVLPANSEITAIDPWLVLLFIFLTGILLLLVKMGVQLVSYLRFKKTAQLVLDGSIKVYQVNQPINPFSFGRAVFLNKSLHTEAELTEIIRHEFVHVQQGHTLDIIWGEVMCILNWYNPFAWLLRYSLRQNLEYIADNQVVLSGINKKQYQYLLLKVTGAPEFSLTNQFSFLSLKKRIAMMNKMPSTRAHLVKFLLVLPLLAVSLLAFRSVKEKNAALPPEEKFISISGMVVNAQTLEPLGNAQLVDEYSKTESITDSRGYYTLKIPVSAYPVKTSIKVKKAGFADMQSVSEYSAPLKEKTGRVEFVGLVVPKENNRLDGAFVSSFSAPVNLTNNSTAPTYKAVLIRFQQLKKSKQNETDLKALIKGSEKPYWVVNGNSYLVSAAGGYASTDEMTDIVFVDGNRMTGEEVNKKIKQSSLSTLGALEKEEAFKKYGINKPVLLAYTLTNTSEPITVPVPKSGPNNPADAKENLNSYSQRQNPAGAIDAKNIVDIKPGEKQIVTLTFKDGTQEKYDLATPAGKQAYENAQRFTVGDYGTNQLPADYKAFLTRNPEVDKVRWRFDRTTYGGKPDLIIITLKAGSEEVYSLLNKAETAAAENKYGKLPKPALAPPRVDVVKFNPGTQKKAAVKPFEPPTISPDQLPADHKDFLARNPQVKNIGWQGKGLIVLFLKSGQQEKYNLNKADSRAIAEKKYGKLPKAPFPPPIIKKYSARKSKQTQNATTGLAMSKFKVNDGLEDIYDLTFPPVAEKEYRINHPLEFYSGNILVIK